MLTIGIAGGSGSGKTTLSKFLADGLSQRQFMVNDPALREKLDYKIFMDCPSDERLARRLQHFVNGRYSNDEIVNEYLDLVRHRHDLYVEPTHWHAARGKHKGNQVLLEWLLQKLQQK
ncbi:hypothetical protein [Paenibacillus luteus]|uniref:hypothetical protein n=1 Tax=Paenibacillus luteus TaxID=2545753 RepID=UPI0011427589|nr:hypothetical protein [Paenibacillus luteus]